MFASLLWPLPTPYIFVVVRSAWELFHLLNDYKFQRLSFEVLELSELRCKSCLVKVKCSFPPPIYHKRSSFELCSLLNLDPILPPQSSSVTKPTKGGKQPTCLQAFCGRFPTPHTFVAVVSTWELFHLLSNCKLQRSSFHILESL